MQALCRSEIPVRHEKQALTQKQRKALYLSLFFSGAEDGARTRYLRLGKAALYQMSYSRIKSVCFNGDPDGARTHDL